ALDGLHEKIVTAFLKDVRHVLQGDKPERESRIEIQAEDVSDTPDVYAKSPQLAPRWFHEHMTLPMLLILEEETRRKQSYGELLEKKDNDLRMAASALKAASVQLKFRSTDFPGFEEAERLADQQYAEPLAASAIEASQNALLQSEHNRTLYARAMKGYEQEYMRVLEGNASSTSTGIGIHRVLVPVPGASADARPTQSTMSSRVPGPSYFGEPTLTQHPESGSGSSQAGKRRKRDAAKEEEELRERTRRELEEEARLRAEEAKKKAARVRKGLR
ncbi:hypothetical protein HDU93_005058, partial [Gonapodya sp. JEL0774]